MRRSPASFPRVRPPRVGALLALVALLVQLLLPSAATFAMADPLGGAPICTSGGNHVGGQDGPHKAAHRACPLCQAPSVAWGFVPSPQTYVAGLRDASPVVWRHETVVAATATFASVRARGPPVAG